MELSKIGRTPVAPEQLARDRPSKNRQGAGEENEKSLVVGFTLNHTSYLITGDATKGIENKIMKDNKSIPCDILKVGHHGSDTSTSDEFIKYLKVVKLKAELTQLVEMIFNNGEKLNEDNAKMCFCKLENFSDNKHHENDNILNVYQYLVEKLFELNNFNKDVIMNEI
jgi:hypothetical protein